MKHQVDHEDLGALADEFEAVREYTAADAYCLEIDVNGNLIIKLVYSEGRREAAEETSEVNADV